MRGLARILGTALLAAIILPGPAVSAPEVVVLGTDTSQDSATTCGDLAASPYEAGRNGKGVTDEQLFMDGAISACEAALSAAPESAELRTWLARAYILAGRTEDASRLLEEAVALGNPYAAYLLSDLVDHPVDGIFQDPARALELLRQSSDAGFPPAQGALAERYENSNGVDGDLQEALRLYGLASESGLGLATYKLGSFYHRGTGVDIDLDRAKAYYTRAAEQGEPLGYTGLGQMYEFGEGFDQDYAAAADYYQRAADKGEKIAQTSLAYLYEQGLGVAQDFAKSFDLLTDAAAQKWGFAQAALSIHYLFGQGTEIDLPKAFDMAWAAQRSGVLYAEGILGYLYQQGLGATRDLSAARLHFQAGADGGDQYSANQLPVVDAEIACMEAAGAPFEPGVFPGVPLEQIDADNAIPACENAAAVDPVIGNRVWLARAYVAASRYDEAVPLLEEGVEAANVLAEVVLGDLLLSGNGIEADPARAVDLYRQAAEGEFALGQYALGLAYAKGTGVGADRTEALKWLRLAEGYGLQDATREIAALQQESSPDVIDLTGFGREGPGY